MDGNLLPAVQKAYDVASWLLPRTERIPRSYKFTLGDRIQRVALDLNLALVEAAHARSKERPLHRANRHLDELRLLLRLARDVKALTLRQHEHVSGLNEELGRMIGGWLRWSKRSPAAKGTRGGREEDRVSGHTQA